MHNNFYRKIENQYNYSKDNEENLLNVYIILKEIDLKWRISSTTWKNNWWLRTIDILHSRRISKRIIIIREQNYGSSKENRKLR